LTRETHHPQLRNHDRPTEDRTDEQAGQHHLAGNGRVLEGEEQTADGKNLQRNKVRQLVE